MLDFTNEYEQEAKRLVKRFMQITPAQGSRAKFSGIGQYFARECAKIVCDERMAEDPEKWQRVKEYLSLKKWL